MTQKISRKLAGSFFGRKYLQGTFEFLYKIALRGMNFGLSEVHESGEMYVLEYIKEKATKKSAASQAVIFDVGANKGTYALAIDSVFGSNVHTYSFEPGKATFAELVKNTSGIKNLKTYNVGLGASEKTEYLHYDNEGSGLASIYERKLDPEHAALDRSEEISIATLDDFCSRNKISRIDLLKMDVEGYELEVLRGAEHMLECGGIRTIQFEFGGCNIDSRTYFRDFYSLLSPKYSIYRVLQNGLQEVARYSELQEIFTTVNYFAELKE